MEKPLVSIIVPIYNVEKYLPKCLESIKNQTYDNLEILLVNDGSTDNSGKYIDDMQKKESRVKVISKTNGGLSSARNIGLDNCMGEYVCFIDSDDWVDKNFVRHLVEANEKYGSDIAICNIVYIYEDGVLRKHTPKITQKQCVTNMECLSDLFMGKKFRFHAVNKLYRRKLFDENQIRYPEGRVYEDVFTTYKPIYAAKSVSYVPEDLYFYLQSRQGSILSTSFKETRFDIFNALDEIGEFVEKKVPDLKDEYKVLVVDNIISLVNYLIPVYGKLSTEQKKKYKNYLKKTYRHYRLQNIMVNYNLSNISRIRYFFIIHTLDLYVAMYKGLKGIV